AEARPEQQRPLVDLLGDTLEEATSRLAAAGLGDAFVMLRSADQLSDGQRARWRLAQLMAAADAQVGDVLPVVLMDEFAATLDRLTAAIMARNVRRWVTRSGVCAVIATTHDDLLEPLAPDVLIHKPLGEAIEVATK
ncbi:MAG: hypothetical protein KAS72_12780, partial [Phycisphaerales bacterium]|nr:hypothetical protein [Phycisphaerales bacterium]